jgi:hypothetical protein
VAEWANDPTDEKCLARSIILSVHPPSADRVNAELQTDANDRREPESPSNQQSAS